MKIMLDDMREGLYCDIVFRNEAAFSTFMQYMAVDFKPPKFELVIDHDLGETSKSGYEA